MIYELRVYRAMPGRLPQVLARFREHTTGIWDRLGIQHVGFWTTMVGGSEIGDLTYLLAWASVADREARWEVFVNDPEWLRVKAETEKDGPIVADIHNQLLSPTSFSKLQ